MPRLLGLLVLCAAACAQTSPALAFLTTIRVASGLNRPIFVTAPRNDPRLFIVEQRGVIKILEAGSVLPAAFLDIDSLVIDLTSPYDERGLLGLAFHPDFPDSPYFFVDYVDNANQTVIARYQISRGDPHRADHASAQVRLTIEQPFVDHKGGTLAFGPDRDLWIGMGDGGSIGDPGNRAQSPSELLGKMLRIDVMHGYPYSIPADNPFFGSPDPAVKQEIWALGLRNPYRWSFDRDTGDLWIGDVGGSTYEEIDFEPDTCRGGKNYGWRIMEGLHCYNPPAGCGAMLSLVRPILEYTHDSGCAVMGGYVYRGSAIPELYGAYFFADYCSAKIWSLRYENGAVSDFQERTTELIPAGDLSIGSVSAIGQDGFGELYLVDRGNTTSGEVYRLVDAENEIPPDPVQFRLGSPAPNPFTASTRLDVFLDRAGTLEVEVLSASGRVVARLASEPHGPGQVSIPWDGRDRAGKRLRSGIYFLRVSFNQRAYGRRVSLIR